MSFLVIVPGLSVTGRWFGLLDARMEPSEKERLEYELNGYVTFLIGLVRCELHCGVSS